MPCSTAALLGRPRPARRSAAGAAPRPPELGPGVRGQPRRMRRSASIGCASAATARTDRGRDHHRAAGQARLHHRLPLPPRQPRASGRATAARLREPHRRQRHRTTDVHGAALGRPRSWSRATRATVEAPGDAAAHDLLAPPLPRCPLWIDTQGGRLLSCSVSRAAVERIASVDREVAAERFAVRGRPHSRPLVCRRAVGEARVPGPGRLADRLPAGARRARPPTATRRVTGTLRFVLGDQLDRADRRAAGPRSAGATRC